MRGLGRVEWFCLVSWSVMIERVIFFFFGLHDEIVIILYKWRTV